MSEYTQGPWEIRAEDEQIVGARTGGFVDGEYPIVVYEMNTNVADARLIAAAPEMHQWLTAHYALEEGPGQTDRPQYAALKALLNKIKGYA